MHIVGFDFITHSVSFRFFCTPCKDFLWWVFQLHTNFHLVVCPVHMKRFLFTKNWSHNYDTGWVWFHISEVFFLIHFQTMKRHSYDGYSIYVQYMPSFIKGSLCKRDNKFLREQLVITPEIFIGFAPKLVQRFVDLYTKFQLDPSIYLHFIAIFLCVQKDEEKIKPFKEKLWVLVQYIWSDLLQIWYVDLPNLQASLQQVWLGKESWSYIGMKIMFSYFLSIYSLCGVLASWASRHTTMCLDCPFFYSGWKLLRIFHLLLRLARLKTSLLINNWDNTHLYAKYMPGTILLFDAVCMG